MTEMRAGATQAGVVQAAAALSQAPGWREQVGHWIRAEARAAGMGPVTRIDPVKATPQSAVLRAATASGCLYFKAGAPHLSREPAVTALLARQFPSHVPRVVAIDAQRGWMLTHEVRGRLLVSSQDPGDWVRALATLGRIQYHCAGRADDLFEIGCRERATAWVAEHVEELVARWIAREAPADDERRRLEGAIPVWRRMCAESGVDGLADATLDHGDLHPHNIVVTGRGSVYLDWEGSTIGHPFFSPSILLGYMERLALPVAAGRARFRDAYLEPWTAVVPLTALVQAFESFRPIASLRYAINIARLLDQDAEATAGEARKMRDAIAACLEEALAGAAV